MRCVAERRWGSRVRAGGAQWPVQAPLGGHSHGGGGDMKLPTWGRGKCPNPEVGGNLRSWGAEEGPCAQSSPATCVGAGDELGSHGGLGHGGLDSPGFSAPN